MILYFEGGRCAVVFFMQGGIRSFGNGHQTQTFFVVFLYQNCVTQKCLFVVAMAFLEMRSMRTIASF